MNTSKFFRKMVTEVKKLQDTINTISELLKTRVKELAEA